MVIIQTIPSAFRPGEYRGLNLFANHKFDCFKQLIGTKINIIGSAVIGNPCQTIGKSVRFNMMTQSLFGVERPKALNQYTHPY